MNKSILKKPVPLFRFRRVAGTVIWNKGISKEKEEIV